MPLLTDRVLFIDAEALIIDKPAGLPVDTPRDGAMSLENHLASLTFGFQRWPTPVHRLDRDTSGCLLLARNPKAHKRFSTAFEQGTVQKRYLAVLEGVPDETAGTIELPLGKTSSARDGWRMVPDAKGGKAAVTEWTLVANHAGRALISFQPKTGRTHQIRAHALYGIGLGIVGDPVYRATDAGGSATAMLLHSRFLSVPRDGKAPAEATAPLPDGFAAAGFSAAMITDAGL
ncbi:MAG: RNA pseudouridine synthase [Sphingobium sp.]|nr:MAG: RNA pseudouridine synthase [Sphingobium sp.]